MQTYGCKLLAVSDQPDKFGDHTHSNSGAILIVCF